MTEEIDFKKALKPPEENDFKPENVITSTNIIQDEISSGQFYSAAKAIELINNIEGGFRDIDNGILIDVIKKQIPQREALRGDELNSAYADYLDQMELLSLDPISIEDFEFQNNPDNLDEIIANSISDLGINNFDIVLEDD